MIRIWRLFVIKDELTCVPTTPCIQPYSLKQEKYKCIMGKGAKDVIIIRGVPHGQCLVHLLSVHNTPSRCMQNALHRICDFGCIIDKTLKRKRNVDKNTKDR